MTGALADVEPGVGVMTLVAWFAADRFTVAGLGRDRAVGLGLAYDRTMALGMVIVSYPKLFWRTSCKC